MADGGSSVAIVAARRTPIGTAGHGLAKLTAADLAAATLTAVAQDLRGLGVDEDPDDVVLGNCLGPGGNVARVAALQAGLPVSVPGLTVDRQCGSGLAAVVLAVSMLRAEPGVVLAGGVESASTAPWRSWPPVDGGAPTRFDRAPMAPAGWADPDMGPAADLLAREHGVDRRAQDEYAARSYARAVATQRAGGFDAEIVPLAGVTTDDRPRPGLSVER